VIVRTNYRLCVITDPVLGRALGHVELASRALEGGAPMIQLRDKSAGLRDLLPQARQIGELCRRHGARFMVNDRLDLALAAEADGVHLGQDDLPAGPARAVLGPSKILGVSAHTLAQALQAVQDGADYVGVGPIFATSTKSTGREPLGCGAVARWRTRLSVPMVAIGGVTLENVREVIGSGAAGVAVISAVAQAHDVARAVEALLAAIEEASQGAHH
jgi:thiamine-phosphate pyrophosphorylase